MSQVNEVTVDGSTSSTAANTVEPNGSVENEKREVTISDTEADEANHISGDALLVGSEGGIRRLPIPSSDPNDPLNFPKWMKMGIIISGCWFGKLSKSATQDYLSSNIF
jgi:hypothetical protein